MVDAACSWALRSSIHVGFDRPDALRAPLGVFVSQAGLGTGSTVRRPDGMAFFSFCMSFLMVRWFGRPGKRCIRPFPGVSVLKELAAPSLVSYQDFTLSNSSLYTANGDKLHVFPASTPKFRRSTACTWGSFQSKTKKVVSSRFQYTCSLPPSCRPKRWTATLDADRRGSTFRDRRPDCRESDGKTRTTCSCRSAIRR